LIEDSPAIGKSIAAEVIQCIDWILTCELQNKLTSPTLDHTHNTSPAKLIKNHQVHCCNKYCQESTKGKKEDGLHIVNLAFFVPKRNGQNCMTSLTAWLIGQTEKTMKKNK